MSIQLKNIYKSYLGSEDSIKQKVLQGLNLEISPTNSIAITGPSGSGKTTLLNILGTLDKADSGQVIFGNKNLHELSQKELSHFRNQHIGFVFQSHHLLPQLNALDNILLPTLAFSTKEEKENAYSRAIEWLKKLDLNQETYKYPSQLSGGESQRVAVIRALINQPQLLLADEPTGSLDGQSSEKLGDLLLDISTEENISLVVVTHSNLLANKMKRTLQLVEGILK